MTEEELNDEVVEFYERVGEVQNNDKNYGRRMLADIGLLSGSAYFINLYASLALIYLFIGFKMASSQNYGFSDWELYGTTFLWPLLILADLILGVVQ